MMTGKRTDVFTKQNMFEGRKFEMTLKHHSIHMQKEPLFRIKRICNPTPEHQTAIVGVSEQNSSLKLSHYKATTASEDFNYVLSSAQI